MVDALSEICRTLAVGGTLVDLRPVSTNCPIELVSRGKVLPVGEADATGMAADDEAADSAVGKAVERRWFVPGRETRFNFDFYWDRVDEFASFADGSRRIKRVVPSFAELEKIHRGLSSKAKDPVRLRCRRATMLAVYSKYSRS